MARRRLNRTYHQEVLSVLAFEFPCVDPAVSERKIKRRLREKGLGAYDQGRIDRLRALKDDLQEELGRFAESEFYLGAQGESASRQDWDPERLEAAMRRRHPLVPEAILSQFLFYAVYLHYLR